MAEFLCALHKTLKHEGGYSNHELDRGGETWRGISRNAHPNWPGWAFIDAQISRRRPLVELDDNDALEQLVEAFYLENYWRPLQLDQVADQEIADELFDSAVNCGTFRAAKWLQGALNLVAGSEALKLDGKIGPRTLGLLGSCLPKYARAILVALNGFQFDHYVQLVQGNPTQRVFLRGWLNRVRF